MNMRSKKVKKKLEKCCKENPALEIIEEAQDRQGSLKINSIQSVISQKWYSNITSVVNEDYQRVDS